LRVHRNSKNNVGRAIVHYLFKDAKHNFPMIGITGEGDRAGVNRFLTNFFTMEKNTVGSVGDGGVFIGNKRMIEKESNHENIQDMLSNVMIEMAIIDNDVGIIEQEGLSYRYANAIILGTYTPEKFQLLSTQIDIVQEGGTVVLNADDPNVSELVKVVDKTETIIFYGGVGSNNNNVYYDLTQDSIFINTVLLVDSITKRGLYNYLSLILPSIAGVWSYVDLMIPDNRQKLVDFMLSDRSQQ
jgi:hypothetical protein